MSTSWADLADAKPTEDDEASASLIALIPEDRRAMLAPMLRGMLANVKAQISEVDYQIYCLTLKQAYDCHVEGDTETARTIFESFGIPYDILVQAIA